MQILFKKKMARNKEKHVVKLNRLWLQSLDEENLKKNPPRPGLGSLKTASEIKKWIPSIKKDIDFCLKQSQVTCYPERHIQDYTTRVEALTREYKAYIRKLRELEPQADAVPWTDRPYKRKHKAPQELAGGSKGEPEATEPCSSSSSKVIKTDFSAIAAPVLNDEDSYNTMYGYGGDGPEIVQNVDPGITDLPLMFKPKQLSIEAPPLDTSDPADGLNTEIRDTAAMHSRFSEANASKQSRDVAYAKQTETCLKCGDDLCDNNKLNNSISYVQDTATSSIEPNKWRHICKKGVGCGKTGVSGLKSTADEGLKQLIPYSDSSSDSDDR